MRLFRKILFWFLLLFFTFILVGVGFTYFYSEKVEKIVINALNEQLDRNASINSLEFSFFTKFPKASVVIDKVKIDGLKDTDPLFVEAEKVYLAFDLFSLLKDEVVINEVSIENAEVDVFINKKGEVNYNIFKADTSSKETSILNIDAVNLVNVKLNYRDKKSKLKIQAHSYNSSVGVEISEGQKITCAWKGLLQNIQIGRSSYKDLNLEGNVICLVNDKEFSYELKEAKLWGEPLSISGKYNKTSEKNYTKFQYRVKNIGKTLNQLDKDLFPNLTFKGITNIKGEIKDKGKSQSMMCDFSIDKGELKLDNGEALTQAKLVGTLNWPNINNKRSAKVELKEFALKLGDGSFSGSGSLKDFGNLKLDVKLKGEVGIPFLASLSANKDVQVDSGKLKFNTSISGNLKKVIAQRSWSMIRHIKSHGDIEVSNLSFHSAQVKDPLKNISGKIVFDNDKVILNAFSGQMNSSKFKLNGNISHYIESLLDGRALNISADVKVNQLKLEEFLDDSEKSSSNEPYYFSLPDNLKLNLNLSVGSFTFRKFKASNLLGNVNLYKQILKLNRLKFNTCDGKSVLNGKIISFYKDKVIFESNIKLTGLNIKKSFHQFENFGQEFLQEKHVTGNLTTDMYVLIETDKYLNVNDDKLYVQTELEVSNGELTELEPLIELEGFLKKEFKIDLKLKNLKFKTLKNSITIANKTITIPEMNISSSGINLDFSGTHTFDQEINYLFKIKHKEIFKAKRKNQIDEKYGVIENNDKTSTLPLLMTGTVDDPKFSYDVKTKKAIVKQNLKKEGQDVKEAFRKEIREILGKDTTPEKKTNNTTIKVVWDEEEE